MSVELQMSKQNVIVLWNYHNKLLIPHAIGLLLSAVYTTPLIKILVPRVDLIIQKKPL